jgi:predicted RNA-binding protein with PIN domain
MYLIDGHNLIPKLPGLDLRQMDDEDGLLAWLQVFCRVRRQTVEVYFDQAPAGLARQQRVGMVRVHWVRAGRTADDALTARLQQLGRSARNWQVVSSDRRVQAEARACGAGVVSSEAFAQLLIEARRQDAERARLTGAPDCDEVEEWLRAFGELDENS